MSYFMNMEMIFLLRLGLVDQNSFFLIIRFDIFLSLAVIRHYSQRNNSSLLLCSVSVKLQVSFSCSYCYCFQLLKTFFDNIHARHVQNA